MAAAVTPERQGPDLSWSASELKNRSSWRRVLPDDVRDEYVASVAREPEVTAADFSWHPARMPRMAAFGAALREQLMSVDGVCWIRGLGRLGLGEEQLRCLYLALGCALGEPMLQYGRLYPVVDRGASYTTQSVPVSMTNAETCFHTDSSSVDVLPDIVGLLCEEPSKQGGDSLVSNALRVYETLRRSYPKVLAVLELPKVRDLVTPGKSKTMASLVRNRFPVFESSDRPGGVLFRYMRYWIEVGQDKVGAPIDAAEKRAFDLLDKLLARPDNVVRFRLEKGDIIWVNNRVLAHNRTAYKDTPGNTRQLQRMWIQVPRGSACPS